MLAPEEENESEVRREDQDNINTFARVNARLHEVRAERDGLRVSTTSTRLVPGAYCSVSFCCWMLCFLHYCSN